MCKLEWEENPMKFPVEKAEWGEKKGNARIQNFQIER